MKRLAFPVLFALALLPLAIHAQTKRSVTPDDLFAIKDIPEVRISPDGSRVAYTVVSTDRAKNSYTSSIWLAPTRGGDPVELTGAGFSDSSPRWSPDGARIAFSSDREGRLGIWVIDVATRQMRMITPWARSNHFLSKAGESLCWSPDGKQIAFVAAEKGEAESTDPRVITRDQYKSRTSFSDNLHSHIFLASAEDGTVRQLTKGTYDEHSICWNPRSDEIAFLSNHEPDPDARLNYDIFTVKVSTGGISRLTNTPGVEYSPVWSPDGAFIAYTSTHRNITTIDSVAEDTHVWIIGRRGGTGIEASGRLDRRCSSPQWSPDGRFLYFLAGDHGKTLIYRAAQDGSPARRVFDAFCQVSSLSIGADLLAFTRTDDGSPSEVWLARVDSGQARRLTSINQALVDGWRLSRPETIHYESFDGMPIEGWLIRPVDFDSGKKYPMILSIHGGPHGMYGYGFSHVNQVYAARGYAVLYLNPRGSSGYGQKFSDGCVNNWGGADYKDLMKGVDYAISANAWIDRARLGVIGGSYGGFMTNWIITQTDQFKAAVSIASISNLISFYGTSLYQDLIHAEFNGFPWDNYEVLWKYSPIHYVKSVTTPTMFMHGEQDNDVHITQAEEMYMGLKRRNIESVFVRYPREGHGNREPLHRLDQMERILKWFDRHLSATSVAELNSK
jgi:dipeptidyl aminopeptidase/acylaminoacyl peptidase